MTMFNEQVKFRMFQMPCCGHSLCWVNPRLPNFCPECGARCQVELKTGSHTCIDETAWLRSTAGNSAGLRRPQDTDAN